MQSNKRDHLLQLIFISMLIFFGCGNVDDVDISCSNFQQCRTTSCYQCGWPADSCPLSTGDLASVFIPTSAEPPFLILINLTILEIQQEPDENICNDGKLIISNSSGELTNQNLAPDMPVNICVTSYLPGNHTISLSCSEFPTRARYQASIVDSSGASIWP